MRGNFMIEWKNRAGASKVRHAWLIDKETSNEVPLCRPESSPLPKLNSFATVWKGEKCKKCASIIGDFTKKFKSVKIVYGD